MKSIVCLKDQGKVFVLEDQRHRNSKKKENVIIMEQ